MRNFLLPIGYFLAFLLLLSSPSSAQLLIGARTAGMGGAGVAAARGIPAVYYNPAAFVSSGSGKFSISAGITPSNFDKITSLLTSSSDPGKFFQDNYANNLDFTSDVSGIIGIKIGSIGLSVLPQGMASINKAANSIAGSMAASGISVGFLTLGYSFGVAGLPASVDFGSNIKYLYGYNGSLVSSGTAAVQTWGTGSGVGLDAGLLTSFEVPLVSKMDVGFMARDIIATIGYKNKTAALTSTDGTTFTTGPETDLPDTTQTLNTAYVLGAAATIPVTNILVAADLENVGSVVNTHIGIEYPILGMLTVRAGMASGNNLSKTTVGVGLGIPFFGLDAAYVTDGNQAGSNAYVVDISIGM